MTNFIPDEAARCSLTRAPDGMVLIPAGEFLMGSEEGSEVEKPVHRVYLDAYYIDCTPVTNAQFTAFVYATGYRSTAERLENFVRSEEDDFQLSGLSWRAFATPDRKDHPVVCVSWYDAHAYAKWHGQRLPTEAEWEKAARGGLEGQRFPWGNQSPDEKCLNWNKSQIRPTSPPPTTPVKSFPPNGYGLYDMVGNVWEWCADWYADPFYAISPKANPQGSNEGQYRVRRGASWNVRADFRVRCATRGAMLPDKFWPNLGFRCALSIPSNG